MSELTSDIDILDSEIPDIEAVLNRLSSAQGQRRDLEGFRKEAIDRFREIGFEIKVNTYTTTEAGMYSFEFVIQKRLKPFDHEQMSHEVRHDILGVDEAVTIGGDGKVRPTLSKDVF